MGNKVKIHRSERKMFTWCAVLALIVSSLAVAVRTHALDNQNSYAQVRMRGATSISTQNGVTAQYSHGTVVVTGGADVVSEPMEWNYGDHTGSMEVLCTKSEALTFTATAENGYRAEARIDGNLIELANNAYTINNLQTLAQHGQGYEIEFAFVNASTPTEPAGNKTAILRVKGGDGYYTDDIYDETGSFVGSGAVYYTETYMEANLAINGERFEQLRPEGEVCDGENGACGEGTNMLYNELEYRYNGEDTDTTVRLNLATLWHMKFTDKIIVNNVAYPVADYIDYNNQKSWLDHYGGQMVAFGFDVPKATDDIYNIEVKIERQESAFIGNFLWTGDPEQEYELLRNPDGSVVLDEAGNKVYRQDENGNKIKGFDYIGHSTLALVGVAYTVDGVDYACNEEELSSGTCEIPYLEYDHNGTAEFDEGSLVLPAGARVTMRVIPDYGYQVLDVNMAELTTTDDGVGEFTFTVPDGAAYFVANVVAMDDVVNAETDLVRGGSVDLSNTSTLTQGTARLDVKNVELSNEDKEAFGKAAGDYNVKTYLDISLHNVVYKGTEDDAWESQVDELDGQAIITLQLEEGVDGNEIVIVHEKHDGTYEVIESEYDPATHTIRFATSSFSNYAIASRTVASPNTGLITAENGGTVVASMALGTIVIMIMTISVVTIHKRAKVEKS